MKHSEIRARLSDHLERDLSPEERSHVEAHLGTCSECGAELSELRATVSLLRSLPEPVQPPGIERVVMARIARGEGREARVLQLFRRAAEPRFAAPLAAGVAGLFFLLQTVDRGLSTPSSPATPLGTVAVGVTPEREPHGSPPRFEIVLGSGSERRARSASGAGVISGATPAATAAGYGRRETVISLQHRAVQRARIEEVARLLRGAGHPYSASLASHFETLPAVATLDWSPR